MTINTTLKTKNKRMSIGAQFKGKTKPTEASWKLLKDSENMTFDEMMTQLDKTRTTANKACICMNAVRKVHTGEQIARLTLEISRSKCPSKIINAIETAYPNNRMANKVAQLVASEATQHFLARLNAGTGKKTVEDTESEEDQINVEIRSMR